MGQSIQLIVGLGNPGKDYDNTRHNAGAWFVEAWADQSNLTLLTDKKCHGLGQQFSHQGHQCRLLIPTTFMNHSGMAVAAALNYYKLSPSQILIAHDELDLPAGTIKLKQDGGHGGHNGLRDIIKALGTTAFYRLRIGIGHPGDKKHVLNYVLGTPGAQEKNAIMNAIDDAIAITPLLLKGDISQAMQSLHTQEEKK